LTGVGIEKVKADETENQIQDQTTRIEKEFSKYDDVGIDVQKEFSLQIPLNLENDENKNQKKSFDVKQAFENQYLVYQKDIAKMFLKKDQFPRHQVKRKTPKLYITA
jgi:hypothetical protein